MKISNIYDIIFIGSDGCMMNEVNEKSFNVKCDELVSLTDDEIRAMMALCNVTAKFKLNVVLGIFRHEYLNCIFKIDDDRWGISCAGNDKVEIFDNVILACYKLIKASVIPEVLDYVINWFNVMLNQEILDSDFLEFANIKRKQRVK